MSGSHGPRAFVGAIKQFISHNQNVIFYIFGTKSAIEPLLIEEQISKEHYLLFDCEHMIADELTPIEAWRRSKDSSMRKAIEAVLEKNAEAVVSCGNTGALMLISKMLLGVIKDIKRPAITGIFPSVSNKGTVMLDIGANLECNETHLFHFALMGSCFAKVIFNKDNPSIGVLNVGSETTKGRELEKDAYDILSRSSLNFAGFIEGHEVEKGKVDVLITDGFSGNIFLKASEGAANMCIRILKNILSNKGLLYKLAGLILKNPLKKAFAVIDPNYNNGAMLVGLNGIVVKSHGSANKDGIYNAIDVAYKLSKANINNQIKEELQLFEKIGVGLNLVDKIKKTSARFLKI